MRILMLCEFFLLIRSAKYKKRNGLLQSSLIIKADVSVYSFIILNIKVD